MSDPLMNLTVEKVHVNLSEISSYNLSGVGSVEITVLYGAWPRLCNAVSVVTIRSPVFGFSSIPVTPNGKV